MDEYKRYLAEQILTEDKVVTYRLLSRALKVHVNIAKQMLFDFYKSQNDKKPDSVHATYLVYGIKKSQATNGHVNVEDRDVPMSSSMPEMESFSDDVLLSTLSLTREKELKDILAQYEDVTSLHVYSIGPHPMKDLQLLSDTARQVLDLGSNDDLEARKAYGGITNPHVRRREGRGTIPKPAVPKAPEVKPAVPKPVAPAKVKEELKATGSFTAVKKEATSAPAVVKKPPALKRGGSSGIMQSFAKAAAKPKKSQTSQPATPSGNEEDTAMAAALSDDGEDDSEIVPRPQAAREDTGRKSRKEREEALKRMMEEEDEEEPDEPEEKEDTPMEEPDEEPPAPEPEKEEPAEIVSTQSGDGRKRGKRRVMHKKQMMDDQGYLITIQEPGWESFSEDEETPATKAAKPASSASATQASKTKKSASKGNQGSIMSFFAKK